MQRKYDLSEFPIEVELEKLNGPKEGLIGTLLTLTFIAGLIITCVGVATLIFGPDRVMVNRVTGMTFSQFILLYPGPIATIGFLTLGLANMLSNHHTSQKEKRVWDSLLAQLNFSIEDIPEDKILDLKLVEYLEHKDLYHIDLVEREQIEAVETNSHQ